jgi:hypothetical protein
MLYPAELKAHDMYSRKAPQVGLEPTTDRLTADSSTTELLRNNGKLVIFAIIKYYDGPKWTRTIDLTLIRRAL